MASGMMKSIKIVMLLSLFIFITQKSEAQFSNLVIFTQANEPFTLIMNGIQQSPDPRTNIKITGLNAPNYKLKIIFQDQEKPEIEKTMYLQPEVEVTMEVLKNKKGLWILRMLNSVPLDEVTDQYDGQNVFIFTTTPRLNSTTVSQTTTINTVGISTGTSITTTTTQTTSDNYGRDEYNTDRDDHHDYDGPRGCQRPMSPQSFEAALASISSKSFESSKLTIAKQIAASNCLLCKQVKEIMKLFSFESNRLDFARFAYKYTWDINNYFLLNDAFEFESSIDELNKYINKR
jgi:hypothetical protein